jgi:hypothetical protein
VRTRHRLDRHARIAEPGQVPFHGPEPYPELSRQNGANDGLTDCTEKLDEPLLPLDPPKGEVVVARLGGQAYDRHGVWGHMAKTTRGSPPQA